MYRTMVIGVPLSARSPKAPNRATDGAVLAVQIGWAVNQQFCTVAIGCAIDVSFGYWIENWEAISANATRVA